MDAAMSILLMPLPVESGQPPFRGSSRRYSSQQWEEQKGVIERLYIKERRKLSNVIDILGHSGFIVTGKQLKTRISKWGLDQKNVKGDDMLAIARTRLNRKLFENKDSSFYMNKRPVDDNKIDRFVKRNKVSDYTLLSMASQVDAPSPAFSVYTPHPSTSDSGPNTPDVAYSSVNMPSDSPIARVKTPHLDTFKPQYLVDPSLPPSFSWVQGSSMPFTERIPRPLSSPEAPEYNIEDVADYSEGEGGLQWNQVLEVPLQHAPRNHSSKLQGAASGVPSLDDSLDLDATDLADVSEEPAVSTPEQQCEEDEVICVEKIAKIMLTGPGNSDTSMPLHDLAVVLEKHCRFRLAELLYFRVAEVRQKTLGDDDLVTLSAFSDLARIYVFQRKYARAESLERHVLKGRTKILGKEHEDTIETKSWLAQSLWHQGKLDETIDLQREVLEIFQNLHGVEHPVTLNAVSNLATSLREQGFSMEALGIYQQLLESQKKILGEEDQETISTKERLAILLSDEGQHESSELLFKEVLEVQTRLLGDECPEALQLKYGLGRELVRQGRQEEAEIIRWQVWITSKKVLGDMHDDTLAAEMDVGIF